jgi:hypothetical protein
LPLGATPKNVLVKLLPLRGNSRADGWERELPFADSIRESAAPLTSISARASATSPPGRSNESAGFTNHEGEPGGPRMLYYERDLEEKTNQYVGLEDGVSKSAGD